MGYADATRLARPTLCPCCLARPPARGLSICRACNVAQTRRDRSRYRLRRDAGLCTRCAGPATDHLCPACADRRNEQRRQRAGR